MKRITVAAIAALILEIACSSHGAAKRGNSAMGTNPTTDSNTHEAVGDVDEYERVVRPLDDHTDQGCGGSIGPKCAEGKRCIVDSDCEGACNYANRCVSAPSCKVHLGGRHLRPRRGQTRREAR